MRRAVLTSGVVVASLAGGLLVATSAEAAVACRVNYSVTSQWSGGFTANVGITNLGDPVDGWRLTWSFPTGQSVAQAWNASVTQSGAAVTATNASWNGSLAPNGTASFGFNGQFSTTNTSPTAFSLNGVACTGSAPTTPPTTSPPPTSAPPTSAPPTSAPPSTGWNPPSNLVTPLNEVWAHQEETYNNGNLYGFRNYGWDQIMANRGYINYCVRWDSTAIVTTQLRDEIHAALQRQYKKWMDVMVGHNNWPYTDVPVRVVGWAVRDRAQLQWTDSSVDIYVNDIRENAPQCSEPCGRFFNQSGNYPNCPGGVARHYDHSLWLTDGFGGGAGGDWGQRMGREYFVNARNSDSITIFLHELGHTYGLDDFYDWTPTGQCCFIMKAGSSSTITEFDRWMFRDWWRHLKSRYGY
ncbi:cellulose-binding domain-containing protein [Phytohabitans sp. ZYX-F-186]|uniref:Cellulose-binding domain-containing protein n=1 Tax=Phytohabitans maris TaxID=3071409 RepID=A0ABU0ZVH0_9ACTN|nr:cellulose-binding domain-containing protein [Phytohabitans sp. ZYX-F-186]MDQ7911029.1 cellulose-binding domain-containing protein [Phytohabitans sp. ZYX-F-186]